MKKKMHDAHGTPHDARCKMHMAYASDQSTSSPIHKLKFGFYPREGRYAVAKRTFFGGRQGSRVNLMEIVTAVVGGRFSLVFKHFGV